MVRPIDVADHLAKTQAAEKVNQIQKAAPDMDQRQFALQLESKLVQKQEKPTPTEKTDEVIIHREKPDRDKDQQKKKKEKDKKEKPNIRLDLKA
jgi:hypothetical protein